MPKVTLPGKEPIEDGFYYDFELPETLKPEDLEKIEARMREIAAAGQPFVREELGRAQAIERFADQPYKQEIIEAVDESEGAMGTVFSVYRNDGWADLCLGPHVPSTARLAAFKLLSLAGAYWRGDERRPQLQRVYGTAWATEEDLAAYLHRLEEAERRDHRKLGRQLDLFSFPDELGAGLLVWHPRGGIFRKEIEDFEREIHVARGYTPVFTPHLGTIYRHERVGTLHGLLRIRGGTQDDSHIICTREQLVDEVLRAFDLTLEIHRTFGFSDFVINLSTKPGVAIGNEEMWADATEYLRTALDRSGLEYSVAEGEGAFYGPKVDFHARDAIGRLWQLTTIQCDFALPERFDMEYTGEDNQRHRPVMIHRAILGTIERFVGVLIEHYAGAFPTWLAPEQVRVVPIADRHADHARALAGRFGERELRATVDDSRETVQKKIRAAQLMKVPYTLVVGDREIEEGTAAVRERTGKEVRGVPFGPFLEAVAEEAKGRALEGVDLEELRGPGGGEPGPTG